ncbi:MAG TPA: GNAT family N-acetyltransferase [Bacteroidia bacterium]|nr:GNAT family N-acetyltransferase [Bacteroidia bacterium]
MELQIRFADHADLSRLSRLSEETFRAAYSSFNTPEDMEAYVEANFSEKSLQRQIGKEKNKFLLALNGNELAAYAKLSLNPAEHLNAKNPLEIARLYTSAALIGKGIGKRMMEEILTYARGANIDLIWLGVWQKNLKAVAFYQREGFEIAGTTAFTLGNDVQEDFVMTKQIFK